MVFLKNGSLFVKGNQITELQYLNLTTANKNGAPLVKI